MDIGKKLIQSNNNINASKNKTSLMPQGYYSSSIFMVLLTLCGIAYILNTLIASSYITVPIIFIFCLLLYIIFTASFFTNTLIFVIGFIFYTIFASYKSGSGAGIMGWIFILFIAFCLYVLVGLNVTNSIDKNNTGLYILTWGIYSCLCATFVLMLIILNFWSILQKKTGPPGIRGIIGDKGEQGTPGTCSINASQYLCIQRISTVIDGLYSSKPETNGASIYDPILNTFPNQYLTNKIKRMCTSNQFNVVIEVYTDEQNNISIFFDYLTQVWSEWFNLLWVGGGMDWFNSIYADENYEWIEGNNPFDEIRKYDVYYWGLTDVFRPLKAEICRTSSEYQNPYQPYKKEPTFKVIYSNDYQFLCDDTGSKGTPDVTIWRAKPVTIAGETYYPVGDIITQNHAQNLKTGPTIVGGMESYDVKNNGPDKLTILVTGDVKPPVSYQSLWADWYQGEWRGAHFNKYHAGGEYRISTAKPIAPAGYVALGDVFCTENPPIFPGENGTNRIMCVPNTCVTQIQNKNEIVQWGVDINAPWTRTNVQIVALSDINSIQQDKPDTYGYNLIRTRNAQTPWFGQNVNSDGFYSINQSCLDTPNAVNKDFNADYAKLGIGWNGLPEKTGAKYSIFAFMGIVPEGMIIHMGSGRRFYITHYGGTDANKFNVLQSNDITQQYDQALQASDMQGSSNVTINDLQRDSPIQQWIVKLIPTDKSIFNLINVDNSRILNIVLDPVSGIPHFSTSLTTGSLDYINSKQSTFSFVSSTGVQMNIYDTPTTTLKINTK